MAASMYKSIVVSCNTYYYVLANDMGIDSIAFMRPFGFGQRSGIDLEGEAGRAALARMEEAPLQAPEQQKWFGGETISVGIGQGYNAYTPLQLAQATATWQRRRAVSPTWSSTSRCQDGVRRVIEPQPIKTIPIKPDIDLIKRAMVGVNKEGTGARAFAGAPYKRRARPVRPRSIR
jgi:penicillin-binding protein 2